MPVPSIDEPEIEIVDHSRVSCDGGGGPLGHPKVYLQMGQDRKVDCPYCDKRFVLKDGVPLGGHH
ncbi:zinc-finger domain-containing protein [Rhodospirillaceae bacterium KN72]|uniref:Zinc-finger domain-containing protein n=1 Tax=Pacificispira spongiicola TaxID=2729598 RepID=A0A7Y0HG66_9PROT|nr:zinc-finger domain-containing protein [Pacificispira spongiicola]NMM45338.1 zinc-finger domain-containing protein [Pacificispira spongiicola]